MEGFPTSTVVIQPPSLKDLSSKQVQLWQARKSRSTKTVKGIMPDKTVVMSYTGATDGKRFISQIETGVCKVNSFKLSDFAFRLINSTSGVLTYHAIQDAMCTGKPLPPDLRVEIGYLNTDGRWKMAFYVEDKPAGPDTGRAK